MRRAAERQVVETDRARSCRHRIRATEHVANLNVGQRRARSRIEYADEPRRRGMTGIGRLCHAPHADHRDEWNGGEKMWQNGAGSFHAATSRRPLIPIESRTW